MIGVAYTSELVENQEEMRLTYLLAAVLLFGAALVFAALLSEGITRPVKELKNSMKEVEQGLLTRFLWQSGEKMRSPA